MKKIDGERVAKLLLSGAKMTDKHCEKCLYPLFEKEGTVFCVNCGAEKVKETDNATIVRDKMTFLYRQLESAETVEEIEKIGRALEVLKRLLS
jgi:UPF0148 protein